jgi:hypothetical protein
VNCPAWIDFCDGSPVLNCTVVNLSTTGAKIAIRLRRSLPETFIMRFSTTATIGIICKPIWAREGAFGVQFLRRIGDSPETADASGTPDGNLSLI